MGKVDGDSNSGDSSDEGVMDGDAPSDGEVDGVIPTARQFSRRGRANVLPVVSNMRQLYGLHRTYLSAPSGQRICLCHQLGVELRDTVEETYVAAASVGHAHALLGGLPIRTAVGLFVHV